MYDKVKREEEGGESFVSQLFHGKLGLQDRGIACSMYLTDSPLFRWCALPLSSVSKSLELIFATRNVLLPWEGGKGSVVSGSQVRPWRLNLVRRSRNKTPQMADGAEDVNIGYRNSRDSRPFSRSRQGLISNYKLAAFLPAASAAAGLHLTFNVTD